MKRKIEPNLIKKTIGVSDSVGAKASSLTSKTLSGVGGDIIEHADDVQKGYKAAIEGKEYSPSLWRQYVADHPEIEKKRKLQKEKFELTEKLQKQTFELMHEYGGDAFNAQKEVFFRYKNNLIDGVTYNAEFNSAALEGMRQASAEYQIAYPNARTAINGTAILNQRITALAQSIADGSMSPIPRGRTPDEYISKLMSIAFSSRT